MGTEGGRAAQPEGSVVGSTGLLFWGGKGAPSGSVEVRLNLLHRAGAGQLASPAGKGKEVYHVEEIESLLTEQVQRWKLLTVCGLRSTECLVANREVKAGGLSFFSVG